MPFFYGYGIRKLIRSEKIPIKGYPTDFRVSKKGVDCSVLSLLGRFLIWIECYMKEVIVC
jgi:hypothetical protein